MFGWLFAPNYTWLTYLVILVLKTWESLHSLKRGVVVPAAVCSFYFLLTSTFVRWFYYYCIIFVAMLCGIVWFVIIDVRLYSCAVCSVQCAVCSVLDCELIQRKKTESGRHTAEHQRCNIGKNRWKLIWGTVRSSNMTTLNFTPAEARRQRRKITIRRKRKFITRT